MLKTSEICGVDVYAPKNLSANKGAYKRMGRVHMTVFAPDGRRVVGFLVSPPDIAGMVKREDVFVALDSIAPCDGGVRVTRGKESFDDEARGRLGLDWDTCIIWTGMDARTSDGKQLGYVGDATFNTKTGEVEAFLVGDGGVAQSLVGSLKIPASMLQGYEKGFMVVAPEAAHQALTGGAAGKAGESVAKAKIEGKKAAAKAGKAAGEAVDKGSRALGKQIGKTRGMFSSFVDEFKKAKE